jgi:hypothetical protein
MGSNTLGGASLGLALCCVTTACQPVAHFFDQLDVSGDLTPGRKLVALPDDVWEAENCHVRPLPYIRLYGSDVRPVTAKRGQDIIYTLKYTACVPQQPGYILGEIVTRVYFKDRLQSVRADRNYPVETGRWVVNTRIEVPPIAEPGKYDVVAKVSADGESITDKVIFKVEE